MRKKHRVVVEVTFGRMTTEKDAVRAVREAIRVGNRHTNVLMPYWGIKSFNKVLAKIAGHGDRDAKA